LVPVFTLLPRNIETVPFPRKRLVFCIARHILKIIKTRMTAVLQGFSRLADNKA
jgi:hypothetical protein